MKGNPFAQAAACWEIKFDAPMAAVIALEDAFEDVAMATASFEQPQDETRWSVQIIVGEEPDVAEVEAQAGHVARALGIALPKAKIAKLEGWQQSLARDFPPLKIGRFYVHGAHAALARPRHLKPIQVEAGMAFGSGEHSTTSGCLLAMSALAKRKGFNRVLDMGCGSGILAIAAVHCWPKAKVLAVDVDAVSARIAAANFRINRVRKQARAFAADGYKSRRVHEGAPYDMILANILARPLVAFSHALARNLAPGGTAVLSGLLASQSAQVVAAHRRQGLRLRKRIVRQGWATLVMER